jgi:acyl-CoA thioester hydrolase
MAAGRNVATTDGEGPEPAAAPGASVPSDLSPGPEFRYRRRVQFAETDLAGIVHFSWYFRYMEEAEHALWRAAGLSISPAHATIVWPRVAAAFDYKSPLRFEDAFTVGVRISGVSRRTVQYGFTLRLGDTLVGFGRITIACATQTPAGVMTSIELPSGLVDKLRSAMSDAAPDEPS